MNNIELLAHKIRFWEYEAGESFTDYFLDRTAFNNRWLIFLRIKGFAQHLSYIEAEDYPDQELTFEPHNWSHQYLDLEDDDYPRGWDNNTYFKDVLLWAEFILSDTMILEELEDFFSEDYESYFADYDPEVTYGLD